MHVVHEKDSAREARQRFLHRSAVESGTGARRHALESVEHARLVALGLKATEEPGAGVRQPLVIQVDRVLRGQDDTQPVRARLFEQCQERSLRWRIGDGGEIAEDLVHVEHRPQTVGPGLRPHPSEHLVQQQRDE